MKKLIACILFLWTIALPVSAQLIRTEYLTEAMTPGTSSSYMIKREVIQSDTGFVYMDYQKNGKLKFRGEYASIHPEVPHGHFQFYTKKGKLESEGNYADGDMVGKWTFYEPDGSLRIRVDYDVPGNICDTKDSLINFRPLQSPEESGLHEIPMFPGGENAFYTFLFERVVYPPLAKMYYKSGKAIGVFTIDESGDVCDIRVEGNVDRDIKREALRVLRLLPKWKPGKIGHNPVSVRYTCPITFKLE